MRFLGQHFLKNHGVLKKIVTAINPEAGDTIIEIGPGHGELTAALWHESENKNSAMRIIAIEKDRELAEALKQRAARESWHGVEIREGDALTLLPTLTKTHPGNHFKIAGNIPYYITGHLLRIAGELVTNPPGTNLKRCVFMVQKEVAERITAAPPKMNRLAASLQLWAEPKIIAQVPRSDFSPPPEVDSAVIELGVKQLLPDEIRTRQYYAAVRALFAQPRKTILNNLEASEAKQASGSRIERGKLEIAAALRTAGINPDLRPQNLTVENIDAIACTLE